MLKWKFRDAEVCLFGAYSGIFSLSVIKESFTHLQCRVGGEATRVGCRHCYQIFPLQSDIKPLGGSVGRREEDVQCVTRPKHAQ